MISVFSNILKFLTDPKNTRMLLLGVIVILAMLLMRQCEATGKAKEEVTRITNNQLALADTIRNYKDKWGNSIGEIRGLKLKIDELGDSIKFEKNKPPVTIIEYKTVIVEKIVEVPVYTLDTVIGDYSSAITFTANGEWGKSSRLLNGLIPFKIENDSLITGSATVDLKQSIWLTASILEKKKTKEVFVELKSDYPGVSFNNAQGVLIDQESVSSFKKSSRKSFGLGLQAGYGYSINGFSPYIGIGLNYTPKFLQW